MLSRAAKSITYIGTMMLIIGLSLILIFSITLMTIKSLSTSEVKWAKDYAEWMVKQTDKTLESLTAIGIVVFIITILVILILIINYLFVNSKTALFQKWSYFINTGFGLVIFITTLAILIFMNGTPQSKTIIKTVNLIIFMTIGLSGLIITIGGLIGLFTKATYIVEINHKSKKERIKKEKIKQRKSKEIQADVMKLEQQKIKLDHKLEKERLKEEKKLQKIKLKEQIKLEKQKEKELAKIQKEQIKQQKLNNKKEKENN